MGTSQYQVLELCINGTLQNYLTSKEPPKMHEDELRGVVKSLVDALTYLRKERIIHRNLKPSSVLLDETFRLKLSDFGQAIRLPSEASTVDEYHGSLDCISPEIAARKPHGLPTDIWSFGCLIITCLTGKPAFDAPSTEEVLDNIRSVSYDLPPGSSLAMKDLISGVLQINPQRRMPLEQIMHHPFLDSFLPIRPLSNNRREGIPPSSNLKQSSMTDFQDICKSSDPHDSCFRESDLTTTDIFMSHASQTKLTIKTDSFQPQPHSMSSSPVDFPLRATLPKIAKLKNRSSSSISGSQNKTLSSTSGLNRRIVSAPQSRAPSALSIRPLFTAATPEPAYETEREPSMVAQLNRIKRSISGQQPRSSSAPLWRPGADALGSLGCDSDLEPSTPGLSLCESASGDTLSKLSSASEAEALAHPIRPPATLMKKTFEHNRRAPQGSGVHGFVLRRASPDGAERRSSKSTIQRSDKLHDTDELLAQHDAPDTYLDMVPVGTTRPVAFNTNYLVPQTHKVIKGQLTVLPSLSLLVDFREGERRKGRRGGEVLLVSPDGTEVQIYDAPHLSTPCCLAEPLAVHPIADLPRRHWKIYNDAARMVDEMKQRVPKLVLHLPNARCTLMANEPDGDIEVMIPPSDSAPRRPRTADRSSGNGRDARPSVNIRLRLFQRHHLVEISRYMKTSGATGAGEWMKKVLPTSGRSPVLRLDKDDWRALEECERSGLEVLWYFVRVCEAVEGESMGGLNISSESDHGPDAKMNGSGAAQDINTQENSICTIKPQDRTSPPPRQKDESGNAARKPKNLRPSPSPSSLSATVTSPAAVTADGAGRMVGNRPTTTVQQRQGRDRSTTRRSHGDKQPKLDDPQSSQGERTCSRSRSILTMATASTGSLHNIFIAPRPARFARLNGGAGISMKQDVGITASHNTTAASSGSRSSIPCGTPRYVPDIGWCIRHATESADTVGGPVRYSLLRPDGTSYEVDSADERGYVKTWFGRDSSEK
ncbi:hypothetical protein EIP86_003710 [Pleurotus ostreatoroseus]|nr:hypothetical protein EIP86_003710 [Pleurotus ostreatoroseus]